MPNLIGGIVLGYTWQVMLNAFLQRWDKTITYDWHLGLAGLVMLVNWQLMGYMMIIYIAGLQNVPPELIEAAQIDGAGRWQTLRSVTITMVMPSITICLFLTLANTCGGAGGLARRAPGRPNSPAPDREHVSALFFFIGVPKGI